MYISSLHQEFFQQLAFSDDWLLTPNWSHNGLTKVRRRIRLIADQDGVQRMAGDQLLGLLEKTLFQTFGKHGVPLDILALTGPIGLAMPKSKLTDLLSIIPIDIEARGHVAKCQKVHESSFDCSSTGSKSITKKTHRQTLLMPETKMAAE